MGDVVRIAERLASLTVENAKLVDDAHWLSCQKEDLTLEVEALRQDVADWRATAEAHENAGLQAALRGDAAELVRLRAARTRTAARLRGVRETIGVLEATIETWSEMHWALAGEPQAPPSGVETPAATIATTGVDPTPETNLPSIASALSISLVQPPRQERARLVAVVLRFDSGAEITYPCATPTKLTRPPSRVDLIGGKSYIDERQ